MVTRRLGSHAPVGLRAACENAAGCGRTILTPYFPGWTRSFSLR